MPGTPSLFGLTHLDFELYPAALRRCLAPPGLFLVPGAAPLKRQQRTPEPLLKRVGVDGIGEAKSHEKIFVLVASASGLDAVLAMEASMASLEAVFKPLADEMLR